MSGTDQFVSMCWDTAVAKSPCCGSALLFMWEFGFVLYFGKDRNRKGAGADESPWLSASTEGVDCCIAPTRYTRCDGVFPHVHPDLGKRLQRRTACHENFGDSVISLWNVVCWPIKILLNRSTTEPGCDGRTTNPDCGSSSLS